MSEKQTFPTETAVDIHGAPIALNDGGKLTAPPQNWDSSWSILVKSNFASVAVFFDWKCVEIDKRIVKLNEKKEEFREMAKSGGKSQKAKLNKLRKMQAAMEALEAELAAAGVSLDD